MSQARSVRPYPKRALSAALAVILLAALIPFQVVTAFAVPIASPTTWYVDTNAGDDLGAGTSEDPLETLYEAVYDRASDGDTILVRPGSYECDPLEIVEFDGLKIASTNGAGVTTLNGWQSGPVLAILGSQGIDIEGFTITGGAAPWAGGVDIESSSATLSNCEIEYNFAEFGGGISSYGSTVTVTGCEISNNFAFSSGAGLAAVESTLSVTDSEVVDNGSFFLESGYYTEFGGGMEIYYSNANISGTTIDGNIAGGAGGMLAWGSSVDIVDSVVTQNEVAEDTGVLNPLAEASEYLPDDAMRKDLRAAYTASVDASQAEYEPMLGFGGGIAVYDGVYAASGSTFGENYAPYEGGALFAGLYSQVTVSDCAFENNSAEFGGAISYDEYNYYLDGLPNVATSAWSARDDDRTGVKPVPGETAVSSLNGVPADVLAIERTVFDGNASLGAPAVYFDTDHYTTSMENCLFTNNRGEFTGAIAVFNFFMPEPPAPVSVTPAVEAAQTLRMANCTFADNVVGASTSLYGEGGSWDVRNTVAWGNSDSGYGEGPMTVADAVSPELSEYTYCDLEFGYATFDTTPTLAGAGNFSADPLFGDDYALTEGSPCIDTGTDIDVPAEDIVGWMRPVDGNGDMVAAWDIGAYEFFSNLVRDAGANRYETAVRACQQHFESADTVIVATGEVFADGLSAAGLAGSYDAPILLSPKATMPALVKTEIERLGASHAIVIGGANAVSNAVAADLDDMGLDVDRIGGADRYETAALVAQAIADREGDDFSGVGFVARGDTFPDALSVSPIAYAMKSPILLVRPSSLPDAVVDVIEAVDFDEFMVAGGPDAVSSMAVSAMDATTVQVGGLDRYDTSAKVSDYAVEKGWATMAYTGIATGEDFPDALTGGAALGVENGVMLLTPYKALHSSPKFLIEKRADEVMRVEVLGGASAISDAVWTELTNILQ